MIAEARAIRDQIAEALAKNGHHPLGVETTRLINTLIKHMEGLADRDREIARILGTVSAESIQAELSDLRRRKIAATDSRLRSELARAVRDCEGQLRSYNDLQSRREIGLLRLSSAISTLRKIRLDSARIESLSPTRADLDFEELRTRSAELSQYIEDMEQAYRDLQ